MFPAQSGSWRYTPFVTWSMLIYLYVSYIIHKKTWWLPFQFSSLEKRHTTKTKKKKTKTMKTHLVD